MTFSIGSAGRALAAPIVGGAATLLACCSPASAQEVYRQGLDEAWWTGPLLTAGASTLPAGHVLIEPYLFDVKPYGRFDAQGDRVGAEDADNWGSSAYLLYGVTDRFTAGAIPRLGYQRTKRGHSSNVRLGDLTLQGQYRLTQYREGSKIPTISLVVQEALPTGRHDRLDSRPHDGFGSGAYATALGVNSQFYAWMPNGRILRTRLNLNYTRSDWAKVHGQSVYGTPSGFAGKARPGDGFTTSVAFEYSITRQWVAAMDIVFQHDASTAVRGRYDSAAGPVAYETQSRASRALILAPAIEYNFSPTLGVIFGTRVVAAGSNTTASVAPVFAINYVR